MDDALVEKVARAMVARRYPSLTNAEQDEMWDAWVGDAQAAIAAAADDLRLAGVKEGLEMAGRVAEEFEGTAALERCDDPLSAAGYAIGEAIRAISVKADH